MRRRLFSGLLVLSVVLSACSAEQQEDTTASESNGTSEQTDDTSSIETADTTEMDFTFSDKDLSGEYDESEAVDISKNASEPITAAGTYVLTGNITDTVITVAAGDEDKVQIVLDNVTLENAEGPAIYIQSADKVFITVKDGTTNTISDGTSYSMIDGETTVDAAIFSKADLTINGSGTLSVSGNYKHGIVSKDDLVVTAGNLNVTSQKVGLNGKDCVKIGSSNVNIAAGSDGIRSDNEEDTSRGYIYLEGATVNITAENDGIQAETVLNSNGADVTINAGSGSENSLTDTEESYKGMKAGSDILISGGNYTINSQDDGIHSNNTISITDGTITLSSGDDGIHADTDLSISGGTIDIIKSYEGLEGTRILISGGTISLVASDDGLNAAGGNDSSAMGDRPGQGNFSSSTGEIVISGGYISVDASGDGIDSNGSLEISGGITLVSGPTNNGNGALDYDSSATITDGVLIALGSSGMAQSIASSGNQGVLDYTFSSQSAGTTFLVSDSDGNVVVSFTPAKAYECAVVTAPGIQVGSTYSVVVSAAVSGADENGYAEDSSYTDGIILGSSEASSGSSGSSGGGQMPDRGQGGRR
ncbi:MAG: carbohydrate-binding domain-containing protein [Bacillus sp. (in: firmicutes)]